MIYLPKPPSDEEKYLYVDQNKTALYLVGAVSLIILFVGMAYFVLAHPAFYAYSFFVLLLFLYLGASYYVGIMGKTFDLERHDLLKYVHYNFFPTVDVYLPCCGEPLALLENTYKYVSLLEYPRDKLNIYVLDDKGDDAVQSLAIKYNFHYITRHPDMRGVLKKAGNIRHAFSMTDGEFILILDADFVPRSDMLTEVLPHFASNPNTAIVQSPQYFSIEEGQTWIMKGAAYVQELFYRLIQVNRSTWNASVCVGTCAIYSRKALAPHGGTAAIAYSEDLHTGFQAYADGHKIVYVAVNLSKGACPDSFSGYMNQQYRWCTGSFSLFLNKHFWKTKMEPQARLSYMTGMLYYIATALALILVPLPTIAMVWFYPDAVYWYNVLYAIPSFVYGVFAIALWSKAPWGTYALKARQASYWAHLLAIKDKLYGATVAWVPTGDSAIKTSGSKISTRAKWAMIDWSFITVVAVGSGVFFSTVYRGHDLVNFLPGFFFTIFNSIITLSATLEDE